MAKYIEFKPPFRVGKRQKRVVLDSNGVEVVLFSKGHEAAAQEYCDFLNLKHKAVENSLHEDADLVITIHNPKSKQKQ